MLLRALNDSDIMCHRAKDYILICYVYVCVADPEVTSYLLGPDYEFLVVACDGMLLKGISVSVCMCVCEYGESN